MRSPSCCNRPAAAASAAGGYSGGGRFHKRRHATRLPRHRGSDCQEDGIVAGLAVYARVFTLLDPSAKVEFFCRDGDTYSPARSWPLLRAIYAPCFPVSALR